MKKLLFILISFLLYGEADVRLNSTLWPDLRLSMEPILMEDSHGITWFFEKGRQIFRANATYGKRISENCFGKLSFEYLKQRLGLTFSSGREHKWVKQGEVGMAFRFPDLEVNCHYSHSTQRKLFSHVIPNKNAICDKNIAGSHAFGILCTAPYSLWEGGLLTAGLGYDYTSFKRLFQKNKVIQGLSFKLGMDQFFAHYGNLHLGVAVRAPFLFYEASFASHLYVFGCLFDVAIYGGRVHGLKKIPSSSRIGIEIGFDLNKVMPSYCDTHPCKFRYWLASPAVYSPEVLVLHDEKVRDFCLSPLAQETMDLEAPCGFFSIHMASFFSGTSPMIYHSSPLPGDLKLNAVTGEITGRVDDSLKGTYEIAVKATNYSGEAIQTMILHFNK